MRLIVPRKIFGLCLVLLLGLWSESASAWQFGAGQAPANAPRRLPRDSNVPLEKQLAQEQQGRELFVRDWSKPDSKPATGGDGLGPMFNSNACVGCHDLGGIGGAGDASKNVRLLHLVGHNGVPLRAAIASESVVNARQQAHPDFGEVVTTVVLHRHQIDREAKSAESMEYLQWLGRRLPSHLVDRQTKLPLNSGAHLPAASNGRLSPLESASNLFRAEGLPVRLTERNTPALFGAGLIDSIPDAAIVEQAERQKKHHGPFISGRVPQDAFGAIGRFGWRGQVAGLHQFVLNACSVELGLSVPAHPQAGPVIDRPANFEPAPGRHNRGQAPREDLTHDQCVSLTTYVATLSAPQPTRSSSLDGAKSVQRGEALFEKIGCAVCHASEVGSVSGLYSDLLLHDMGPNLADPSPANPEIHQHSPSGRFGGGSGYGGSFSHFELVKNITTKIHQEWRTPALWGVASSAPYLHDGRAPTLEDAIQWHGGEGQRASEAFRALKPNERQDLIHFLGSLAAPNDNPQIRQRGGFGSGGGLNGGGGGGFF